ncbi:hypothetical protein [Burkholderia gladioli]|uniref:hypothetical protein n=1 Tax=Burkholderia gladioli TaxID=28095 RepID=UPI0034DAFB70
MESIRIGRDYRPATTGGFGRKMLLVLVVFATGLLGGFQFAAWYLPRHLQPDALAHAEDRIALAQIKEFSTSGWIGFAFLVVAMCVFLNAYRVTRHSGR